MEVKTNIFLFFVFNYLLQISVTKGKQIQRQNWTLSSDMISVRERSPISSYDLQVLLGAMVLERTECGDKK